MIKEIRNSAKKLVAKFDTERKIITIIRGIYVTEIEVECENIKVTNSVISYS